MNKTETTLLAVNGGSSTLKLALYQQARPLKPILSASVDRIGKPGTVAHLFNHSTKTQESSPVDAPNHEAAAAWLIRTFNERFPTGTIAGIGHRIVSGGASFTDHQIITSNLLASLKQASSFDPEHLPSEIALIEKFQKDFPKATQVACFDTVFHRTMPREAYLIPIPRRYEAKGVRRMGYHGLSYAFLVEELARIAGPQAARGRVILCHLGNGASIAAVCDGKSIDTSMGLTPTSGVMMSTRSGDIDPELSRFLARTEKISPADFHKMVNHESGLLGLSETSSDVRDLLKSEASDVRAAEALAVFCYQIKKQIGAYTAALGGLDTLVFAAGIGENAPTIRSRICSGLSYLGIELDESSNNANAEIISKKTAKVPVRVIHTNEELMIANIVDRLLTHTQQAKTSP